MSDLFSLSSCDGDDGECRHLALYGLELPCLGPGSGGEPVVRTVVCKKLLIDLQQCSEYVLEAALVDVFAMPLVCQRADDACMRRVSFMNVCESVCLCV